MRAIRHLLVAGLLLAAGPAAAAPLVIEDFEDVDDWSGLEAETTVVQEGAGAGRWADTVARTSISRTFDPPLDLSGYDHLGFWLYSEVASGAELQLVLGSENAATSGSDYYSTELRIDWQGWRWIWLALADLPPARTPLGWDAIDGVSLAASGWDHTPLPDTSLVLDQLVAANAVVTGVTRSQAWAGDEFVYTFDVALAEPDGEPLGVDVAATAPAGIAVAVEPSHVELPADATAWVTVTVTLPPTVIADGPYLGHDVELAVTTTGGGREAWIEPVATPPPPRAAPRMLITAEDLDRIDAWAAAYPWAASRRQALLDAADAFPASFLDRYGLAAVTLPPEGGQWGAYYVCPDHGAGLDYEPPLTHRCPVDGATFAGWPYDQVIYARQHDDLARAAWTLALAARLTGDATPAAAARDLLAAYAETYEGYPIHGLDGTPTGSGARVHAQTLDESGWLINVAWAYDLLGDDPALGAEPRDRIEQHLLRPAAAVIARNDAGTSNWQAWHNAAVAAAGRALDDPRLVARALHGPSGFHFHMAESVLADGFWYEGSWGYHFYTLTPMTYLAELGERGDFPLYDDPALRSMYLAPVRFAPPDLVLPAFNDSSAVDLRGSAGWRLEAAYRAYGDAALALPLVGEARPTEALFFGAETLPDAAPAVTESLRFEASGYALLRGGTADDPWWAALDYGPHGGWHGHYDKLGLVLFARGRTLGLDPGSHSYALPLHDTWDRATLAHDTVVVDEAVQAEATGQSARFEVLPGLVWARARGGAAAPGVALARDVVMADGYLLDRFTADATDGLSHRYDWIWHAEGDLASDLPLADPVTLPDQAGYQHVAGAVGTTTDGDAGFTFAWDAAAEYPGSLWSNDPAVVASQTYDDQVAHGGAWSDRLDYDFTAAGDDAYVTYHTRSMAEHREETPTAVAVWVHGDGSGHALRLRVVDGTGESHVSDAVPLDLTGWQELRADLPAPSHWSGDDDGEIDLPLGTLVLELDRAPGAPAAGTLHLDDWRLTFPVAGEGVVESYERLVARHHLVIAGAPATTYVAGTGLGPDLQVPVPLVMARRQGERAAFDVLHEPHGESGPAVTRLEPLAADPDPASAAAGFRVVTGAWTDELLLVGEGPSGTARTFGALVTDGILAHARTAEGGLARLAIVGGARLARDGQDLLLAPAPLARASFAITPPEVEVLVADGDLEGTRLLAPGTTRVTYAGQDVAFTMDGDYVVFGRLPGGDPGDGDGCGCAATGHGPGGSLLLLLLVGGGLWRRRRGPTGGAAGGGG